MDRKVNPDYVRNLALATVAGQSGCMTVILIFMGLFGGMYIDSRLDTHPIFTIGLVLLAIPDQPVRDGPSHVVFSGGDQANSPGWWIARGFFRPPIIA